MSNYENRLNNNNLNLMNIMNTVSNLPDAGGGAGNVKLFDSIANMQADPNPVENGLAVVYHESTENLTADTEFQVATFPETVTLPSAVTVYMSIGFVAADGSFCDGSLLSDSFSMNMYSSSMYKIQYTSSDGINYTRTQISGPEGMISGDDVDFGTVMKFGSNWGEVEWNDAIGYFIQTESAEYQGLFQCKDNAYSIAKTQLDALPEYVYGKTFYGKNGVEIGSLNEVTNLNPEQLRFRINIRNMFSNLSTNNLSGWYYESDISNEFDVQANLADNGIYSQNVTNVSFLFGRCTNVRSIVNMPDTSNVTNMNGMFWDCNNLTSIPNLNTTNVTSMTMMFENCNNLASVPNFNTSRVTDMSSMFKTCVSLTSVPNLDTSNVTSMAMMLYNCRNLTSVSNLNTANVTTMGSMFLNCTNLTSIPNLNTANVTYMTSMFLDCYNLTSVPEFDTANVTNMDGMFRYCNNLSNTSIQNIVNMCINSNITTARYKNLNNANIYSPFYSTNITNSRYSNRLEELTAAGWTY